MKKEIFDVLARISELEVDEIEDNSNLKEDLSMDSLMIIDLVVELEKILGKTVTPEEIAALNTVKDVLKFVNA